MKTWIRIYIIAASVGGGLLGATLVLLQRSETWSSTAITVAALEMYGFVAVSGCLWALDWRKGHLLLIALALQVPYVTSSTITYKFGVGFHFFIVIGDGYIGFDTLLGSVFRFGHTDDVPSRMGINVVALAALIFLFRMLNTYERTLKSTPATDHAEIEGGDTLALSGGLDTSLSESIPVREAKHNSDLP